MSRERRSTAGDSSSKNEFKMVAGNLQEPVLRGKQMGGGKMPDVTGMGLKDALFVLERKQIKVLAKGRGKVVAQSISAGSTVKKGQTVMVELN